jgi:hypothetical protein
VRSPLPIPGQHQTLDHRYIGVDGYLRVGISAIVASSLFGIPPKHLYRQGAFGDFFHLVRLSLLFSGMWGRMALDEMAAERRQIALHNT